MLRIGIFAEQLLCAGTFSLCRGPANTNEILFSINVHLGVVGMCCLCELNACSQTPLLAVIAVEFPSKMRFINKSNIKET